MKLEPVQSPLFPKATEILFYTGNTLASLKLMKKTNTSITEEVIFQSEKLIFLIFDELDFGNDVNDVTNNEN